MQGDRPLRTEARIRRGDGAQRGLTLTARYRRSPDFNPIEKASSKLKALLRKAAERTVDALWDTISRCIDLFTPTECANYFASCGYDAY